LDILKGERVLIHEINPYLLEENHQRFLQLAQALGIEDEVGLLVDYQDREKLMENKRAVFCLLAYFCSLSPASIFGGRRTKRE